MSLSDEVWRAIKARPDLKAKQKRERLYFRCLRHEDNTPSAWTAGGAHGCFSCGFEEPITTLAPMLGIVLEGSDGYTLERYAVEKGFSADRLREWGLSTGEQNGRPLVRIPYYDEDGKELRARYRSATGKWWEGKNLPIYLYGRDRLADAKQGDRVLVVEGESDCHALWSEGILAVGVPGATSWRDDWQQYLNGLEVYVWEEPDQGGAQMVERIVGSFPKARIIHPNGSKDPCEMRQKEGTGFADALQGLMDQARPHGAPEPPVQFDVLNASRFKRLLEHQLAPIDAVPTPFPDWNRSSRDEGGSQGIARGWHVLAAARTGVGKSILALNMAYHAMMAGESVCFVSLEMSQQQVEIRLLAIASEFNVNWLEKGPYFNREKFEEAAERFGAIPGRFVTNRRPIYSTDQVVQSIRSMHDIHGCGYFIVDYIQLAANQNDPESITAVSHAVRQQAKDLQVITVGLSQFNRSTSVQNEAPTIHGLTGGSSLENDADQIVLIDHSKIKPVVYSQASMGIIKAGWTGPLLLAKNRHGPSGDIPMGFSSRTLRMYQLDPDQIPDNLQNGTPL